MVYFKITRIVIAITFLIYLLLTFVENASDNAIKIQIPVNKTEKITWSPTSYWAYPWSGSGHHKGIDLFAKRNSKVISPVNGILIDIGNGKFSGNYLYILGADLRLYYFAHLESFGPHIKRFINIHETIGYVGDSGNAQYSPCHLHFSIFSIFPIVGNFNSKSHEGWKRMFYLDPVKYFNSRLY